MRLTHLALAHFRNYAQEDVEPAPGANVLLGDNAQGKSNLLEAIVCLSTTRSYRTSVDRHLINRAFLDEVIPYSRLVAHLEGGPVHTIELVVTLEQENGLVRARRHLRLDGAPHRLLDALGSLPTVLFTPDDILLVGGPPAGRRRYLDVLLCQASRPYCRALSLYNRSLLQRNSLLRLLRQRQSDPDQLHYWDELLAEHGAELTAARASAVAEIAAEATEVHGRLAGGEQLGVAYRPAGDYAYAGSDTAAVAAALRLQYGAHRQTDIERGLTTIGPHRDDLGILLAGQDVSAFGSRGQMRTIALALRLAEADYLATTLGRQPVLLMDDVMSELDAKRRHALEEAMLDSSQSFVTDLDQAPFSPHFLAAARLFRICAGRLVAFRPGDGGSAYPRGEDTWAESEPPFGQR